MRINMSYYFHKLQDKAHISDEPKIKCICSIMSSLFYMLTIKTRERSFERHPRLLTQCCACPSSSSFWTTAATTICLPYLFTHSKHAHASLLMCTFHIIDATQ